MIDKEMLPVIDQIRIDHEDSMGVHMLMSTRLDGGVGGEVVAEDGRLRGVFASFDYESGAEHIGDRVEEATMCVAEDEGSQWFTVGFKVIHLDDVGNVECWLAARLVNERLEVRAWTTSPDVDVKLTPPEIVREG